ncbi:ROK family transcriptional regulator [Actinocatenispora rupis]|uniref:Sugar kinase n=1 Tax=Actinocatenispora rupis TaxID=519421 RepID=A0A8J3J1Z8_9ACTN|nr:ROK family transcriptional regulator [Actinocatenispora rupis]GID10066.1 sugar kinase [Actinocatenispora rupis]
MTVVRPENVHQARLMRRLRDDGPRSRAELGDAVALSRSKLAAEIDRLVDRGLLDTDGYADSRGGRRSAIVRVGRRIRFAGIDIGATSVDVALTDGELHVLSHRAAPVDVRDGPDAVIARALAVLGELRDEDDAPLAGAGVGVPGPVSFADGVPVSPPIMPGWNRFPVRDTFAAALGCPVLVDNDVNIMALGEKHAGVARSVDDFLFVKIGTGIGCGIVVRGEVYRGVNGCAGDIGHMSVDEHGPVCACGNIGCLEAFFGGAALRTQALTAARTGRSAVLARRLAEAGDLSAVDVTHAASAGDGVAVAMIREGGQRLGHALAGLVSFVNPGLVVIGGGVASIGHALLAEIRGAVYRTSLPLATGNLPITLSELGGRAGVVGAVRLASDHLYRAA